MLVAGNRSGRTRMRDLHRTLLSARFKRFWGAMSGRVHTKFLHEVCATWGFANPFAENLESGAKRRWSWELSS